MPVLLMFGSMYKNTHLWSWFLDRFLEERHFSQLYIGSFLDSIQILSFLQHSSAFEDLFLFWAMLKIFFCKSFPCWSVLHFCSKFVSFFLVTFHHWKYWITKKEQKNNWTKKVVRFVLGYIAVKLSEKICCMLCRQV